MAGAMPVVIDTGTGSIKAGFACDTQPRAIIPCAVARSVQGPILGLDALAVNGEAPVSYPMSCGCVRHGCWDDMQLLWDCTWQHLGVHTPSEHQCMLTDAALNPTANKQRMIEIMLEHYGFAAVGMQVQAVLSLYAHGLNTGVVLDSGDGTSHAVAVVEGYAMSHLTQRLEVAGRHVTEQLMEQLIRRGAPLHRTHDLDWVRRIKEASCFVAVDYKREVKLAHETTSVTRSYTLPDGRVIKVGEERFQAPEVLFNPGLLDKERPGLAQMVFNAIHECDIDNRRQLYEQVVLSGGSTMFPGCCSRLEQDLRQLYLKHVLMGDGSRMRQLKLRVHDSIDRQNQVFKGAAILARLTQDQPDCWIQLDEWREDPHRAMRRLGVLAPV